MSPRTGRQQLRRRARRARRRPPLARAARVGLLLAGCASALSACGGSSAQATLASAPPGAREGVTSGASGGAHGGPSAASSAVTCRNAARSVCITRGENGRTVTVGIGWTVGVQLRAQGFVWSAPTQLSPRVLRQAGSVVRANGGVQVDYTAVAAGRTTLQATERPRCAPGRACPQFIVLWQVHVRVNRR